MSRESKSSVGRAGARMPSKGQLPTFLVIGAPKAGTTALFRFLAEHPEIGVSPQKEIRFFGNGRRETVRRASNLEEYRRLFQPAAGEKAWGEASPQYLHWSDRAAEQIREAIPGVKLIVVIRDPAERGQSQYTFMYHSSIREARRAGFADLRRGAGHGIGTPEGFSAAIRTLPRPMPIDGPFPEAVSRLGLRESFYARDLENYLRCFDRDQIRVHLYEDLRDDPVGTMQDLYGFLQVDPTFTPQVDTKYNVTRVPRSRRVDTALHGRYRLGRLSGILPSRLGTTVDRHVRNLTTKTSYQPLEPADREILVEVFRDDVVRTAELVGRDLSAWLR